MKAVIGLPEVSENAQAASNDQSKRSNHGPQAANLYARLRRLEQRIANMEASLSTVRRDVYRIEKKQQRTSATAFIPEKTNGGLPLELAGLFGGTPNGINPT